MDETDSTQGRPAAAAAVGVLELESQTVDPARAQSEGGILSSLNTAFRAKPHTHCEACDRAAERREKRRSELECCSWVARTFMMAFLLLFILGVVVVTKAQKH